MKLAILLTVTAMVACSFGVLVAALCAAASRGDRAPRPETELDRARRERQARELLATYPRPKGHPMSTANDDLYDLTWPAKERELQAIANRQTARGGKHAPSVPVRNPLGGLRALRIGLVMLFVIVASLAIGVAMGKAEGRRIAEDARLEVAKAAQTVAVEKDAVAYWRGQAGDRSAEIDELEAELESATVAAELAKAAATPAIVKQSAPKPATKSTAQIASVGSGVERWRGLVGKYFKAAYVDDALSVMRKESGGDPNATNARSGAAGLFQQIPRYWPRRLAKAEAYFHVDLSSDIHDPEANIAVSAWGSKRGTDWSHWSVTP